MNYFELYPGDYMRDTAGLSLPEHGAYLLLLATYYGTELPLASDSSTLHRICRAMTPAERKAVDSVANRYFPVSDDGLRHNARADAEISKAAQRMADAPAKRQNEAERQRRARERRKGLFDQLRAAGITPAFDVTTAELVTLLAAFERDSHGNVTRDNTATRPQTPDPTLEASGTKVPDADGVPATKPVDPIWDTGLAFLVRKGLDVKLGRSYLGKFRKTVGDDFRAGAILADAEAQDISDPIPWLVKAAAAMAARSAKPSATDDFRGKTYAGTADDDLPESLR